MIIFDTETTGLVLTDVTSLSKQPRIIEFAAVKVDSKLKVVDEIDFMCNPGIEISPKITQITGITNDDLKDKEPFAAHYSELCDFFLGERSLLTHNAPFDVALLKFDLMRIDKVLQFPWPHKHICTIKETRHLKGKALKLINLYEMAMGKKLAQTHRAMDDVEALLDCVKWCVKKGIIKDVV